MTYRLTVVAAVIAMASVARADDDVTVHVTGSVGGRLEQSKLDAFPNVTWRALCVSPCTVRVARKAWYRIAGGARASVPRRLPDEADEVTLRATLAPESIHDTGTVLTVMGVILSFGIIPLAIGLGTELSNAEYFCLNLGGNTCTPRNNTGADFTTAIGAGTMLAGAVVLAVGLVLLHTPSGLAQIDPRTRTTTPPPKPIFGYHDETVRRTPPIVGFPLLRVAF